MSNPSPLAPGSTLEKRYRIIRELGRGGFGRTYLAEDTNRYGEQCVLKEFSPVVHSPKAAELFDRESSMLYSLQHPQIPRFRELLRTDIGGSQALFLVQDYIPGQTYEEILISRQQQGKNFSEAEVTQILFQLLPVLEYIHSKNLIHRDISPDNIIQHDADKLPFLIDFGSVKQIAASALFQSKGQSDTAIGKQGYSPMEQMRQGKVSPASDLYALAVTALVLLTGKKPQKLYDVNQKTWDWRDRVSVSQNLGMVLDRMLADRSGDRYQSAKEVREALKDPKLSQIGSIISQMVTMNFVGRPFKNTTQTPTSNHTPVNQNPQIVKNTNILKLIPWKTVASLSVVLLPGVLAFGAVKSGFTLPKLPELPKFPELPQFPTNTSLDAEIARQEKIGKRRKNLNIDPDIFYQKVDELFYNKYPELQGRTLTDKPEDAEIRQKWCEVAEDFLDNLEKGGQL
ncbi:MAG: serine/threonine protein kinase [Microcoleus sp. PH2017_29_MFU_D_A]|jgi:serine/threonine protein kinase|uniref:serine/threonine-protein kinase n=1 Tax=unclassified Microcoleus TaxID=2642155 RepID=UPI001D4E8B84|nr:MULTISPECIES: serine/threonine-protein kinase [unclassified Microcoleus]TAE71817.1 MAG: serine/threonine protein kinase [Oscillatoriales cyanobacterium]MCC3424100.1 serine/threonine protein kinase [Microcoleus sp. PH2017_01_SCD_O_A]MCC3601849.1 serine/threonine protein kinase [Microcoleus sp. PH2017_29_MFU_D_A]MCC3633075.1 serine/threonine protein kinase [Microcoleus sp. PH2017_37_MFU_D_B]TAG65718.1 MAG: serine/threonine protein kinase [Oscillatoriales cyanobacterium]